MNRTGINKLLTAMITIWVFNFIFITIVDAKDLSATPKKKNVHPKISSRLVKLEKAFAKDKFAAKVLAQKKKIRIDNQDKITVYLISEPETTVDAVSLEPYEGELIKSAGSVSKIKVPVNMLRTMADNIKAVSYIKLPDKAIPSAIESEGVALTGASAYHSDGYTGSGVKVAIIDSGFAGLSSAISGIELPNNVIKIDCSGSRCKSTNFPLETDNHGTAVAEIVYDMVPDAQLYLIGIKDTLDLKDAKDYCITNGIDIINHSVIYPNVNFIDGKCWYDNPVCTVNDAYDNGIVWVNSAGNYGTQHYEATFKDTDGDGWHNVSGSDETLSLYAHAGDTILVYMTWDAWPTTDQDYDLFLYNSSQKEVAQSENPQTGTQIPDEAIFHSVDSTGTYYLKIQKYRATSNLQLEVYSIYHELTPAVESSSLLTPADADSVITVGAVDYGNWATGPQEDFSSQGPTNDGRTKPDISGPDNVTTHTFGSFLGTSASGPHVAGACALVKQVYPNWSPDQIKNYIELNATDLGVTGKDNIYGSGLLNLPAIQSFENFIYFPHIASDGTWETEIGIINISADQSLSGSFKAYNNSGQLITATNVSLAPKARKEMIVGNEFTNPGDIGYIIFESDSDRVRGYLKFYVNGKYRVAIPAASDVNTGDIYVSHIASDTNWTTGISILNTTSSSKTLTIEFDDGITQTITIAANEHRAFTVRELFKNVMQPGINSAVIKNGNGIVGLEIFGTTAGSGLNYLSGILLKDKTTTTIFYPHVASDEIWGTGIVAYNPSTTSNNLTITPYNESGTLLTPQTKSLAGKEKYIGLPENLNLPDGTAWFSISASSPITGFELFSTKDGNQLGGYTGVGISGTDGVFAKIDKNGGTGIAFVNIENAQAAVTMTARDDNGNTIATKSLNLNAHEKVLGVPSNLFSQDISNATYIAFSSDREVVGFQLNVSSDNMMLDALPGLGGSDLSNEDSLLGKTELLTGTWHFYYTIITTWDNYYKLDSITGDKNDEGGYIIYGTDDYDDLIVASYYPDSGFWALYDTAGSIDRFYTFYTDGSTILENSCYYQIKVETNDWSSCYTLFGEKIASALTRRALSNVMKPIDTDQTKAMEDEEMRQIEYIEVQDDSVKLKYRQLRQALGSY